MSLFSCCASVALWSNQPFGKVKPREGVISVQSADTGYPLHVPINDAGLHGFACVEMVRTIDVERRSYRLLGCASDATMRQVMGIIRGMYGLR